MSNLKQIFLTATLCALSGIANAVPIIGSIDFDGGFASYDASGMVEVDNSIGQVFVFNNPTNVTAATGSFAPLDGGTVTYGTLDINGLPASPLWSTTVGSVNYSFDLTTITFDTVIAGFRLIKGFGIMTVGQDTATYSWEFSTQGNGTGSNPTTFSFSASQIPEPAIALLLGTGLLGLGVARKLRKA